MTATVTPDRSVEQRLEALARANDVRSRRALLKRNLKAGRLWVVPLLLDPPEFIGTMKVFDLLLATPKYGRVKVNKILSTVRVSPSKSVGGLSERQRGELADELVPVPPRRPAAALLVRDPAAVASVVAERREPVRRPRPVGGRLAVPAPRQPWEPGRGGCGP